MNNQTPITIIATVTAVAGKQDLLLQEQLKLVAATLKEEGCLRYELHHSLDQLETLVFVETWATETHWNAHMEGEAIKAFQASAAAEFIGKITIERLIQVGG